MIGHEKRIMGVKGKKRDEGKPYEKKKRALDKKDTLRVEELGAKKRRRKKEVCGNGVCKIGQ